MPNWCENNLTVTGPQKELARFKKKVRGRGPYDDESKKIEVLSFHQTVPQPKFGKDDDAWYNWRISRWGTKWDAADPRLDEGEKSLVYHFDTAWGPPDAWLRETAKKFPKLEFRLFYSEGGNNFAGVLNAHGEESSNEDLNYLEAMISEYGSYTACCEHCDSDVEMHSKDDGRVCDNCLEHLCANCSKFEDDHQNGKCLFDTTTFKPIKDKDDPSGIAEQS